MKQVLASLLSIALVAGAAGSAFVAVAAPCRVAAPLATAGAGRDEPASSSCCCDPSQRGACGQAARSASATSHTAPGCCEIAAPATSMPGIPAAAAPEAPSLRDQGAAPIAVSSTTASALHLNSSLFADASSPPLAPARPLHAQNSILLI